MEKRRLGTTDIDVPVLTFGAWAIGGWMWGGCDEPEAEQAIRAALDVGMTCIDTAPVYGFGLSESIVGRSIRGRRSEVLIATKCGLRWDREEGEFYFESRDNDGRPTRIFKDLKAASIAEECEASLRRLGVDVIDLYQCHHPDTTTAAEETLGALVRLREQGKIRAIGVSNFSVGQTKEFLVRNQVASNQLHYSLLNRDIETDVLAYCRDRGVSVLTHSTLERGLLAGAITLDTAYPSSDHRSRHVWFQPPNRARALDAVAGLRRVAERHGATPGQAAIAWILAQDGVASAIVGGRNAAQVRENAAAADLALSAEEILEIRALFEAAGEPRRE